MRVYKVDTDVNRYRSLLVAGDEDDEMTFDCTPKPARWKPPKLYCENPKLLLADFWDVAFAAALCVDSKALEKVRTQFEMAGQLLSFKFEKQTLTILNVLECVNCLDHDRCKWLTTKTGRRLYPDPAIPGSYVFRPDRFGESTIFKVPEVCNSWVFCVEREKARDRVQGRCRAP